MAKCPNVESETPWARSEPKDRAPKAVVAQEVIVQTVDVVVFVAVFVALVGLIAWAVIVVAHKLIMACNRRMDSVLYNTPDTNTPDTNTPHHVVYNQPPYHPTPAINWREHLYLYGDTSRWKREQCDPQSQTDRRKCTALISRIRKHPDYSTYIHAHEKRTVVQGFLKYERLLYPREFGPHDDAFWSRISAGAFNSLSLAIFDIPCTDSRQKYDVVNPRIGESWIVVRDTMRDVLVRIIVTETIEQDILYVKQAIDYKNLPKSKNVIAEAVLDTVSDSEWTRDIIQRLVLRGNNKGVVNIDYDKILGKKYRNQFMTADSVSVWNTDMSPVDFEDWVAGVFRQQGYAVETTPLTGDQGADLILNRKGRRVVVQVKFWKGRVGNDAVQQAIAAKLYYRATEAWCATNSVFTKSARSLAAASNVRLIESDELREMAYKIK